MKVQVDSHYKWIGACYTEEAALGMFLAACNHNQAVAQEVALVGPSLLDVGEHHIVEDNLP